MSSSLGLTPALVEYLAGANPEEHPAQKRCRAETAALGWVARMQVSAEQGAFMQVLARAVRARRCIEVGVFTGYSSLTLALALRAMHGDNAFILACDVAEEWTARARGYWREAGVEGLIDLQVRPAHETLEARLTQGEGDSFDFAFIDADKTGYDRYYELVLQLLRPGGIMLFDNVLWSGAVADAGAQDSETVCLRAVAAKAKDDPRVHAALVGIGDGVLMCVKA